MVGCHGVSKVQEDSGVSYRLWGGRLFGLEKIKPQSVLSLIDTGRKEMAVVIRITVQALMT